MLRQKSDQNALSPKSILMAKKGQTSEEVDEDDEHHTPKQIAKKPRTGNSKATGSGASRKRKVTAPVDSNQEVAGDQEDGQTAASKSSKKKGGEGTSAKTKKGKAAVIQRNEESAVTAATGEVDDADDEIIDRGSIQINAEDSTVPTTDAGGQPANGTAAPTQDAAKTQPQQEEEDDEALEDDVVAKPSQTIGREETKALLDTFDEITLSRYEVFRRAHLTKASMKKIVSNLVGPVPASVAIVVSGVGKIFVGEMVESALEIMDERGETGPIAPEHLREAFRRYQKKSGTMQNKLFNRQVFG